MTVKKTVNGILPTPSARGKCLVLLLALAALSGCVERAHRAPVEERSPRVAVASAPAVAASATPGSVIAVDTGLPAAGAGPHAGGPVTTPSSPVTP